MPPIAFAIPSMLKAGLSIAQLIKGASMRPNRPEYEIPGALQEEVASARMEAGGRMPGIGYAEDRLRQNAATGAYRLQKGATNPNQLLAGLSNIQMQSNVAERGLLESEANDHYRRIGNLRQSLRALAGAQDRQFDLNKMQPYQDAARTKAALIQSGLTNAFGAAGEGLQGMMAGDMYNTQKAWYQGNTGGMNPAAAPWLSQGATGGLNPGMWFQGNGGFNQLGNGLFNGIMN